MTERRNTGVIAATGLGGAFTSQATKPAKRKARKRTCAGRGCNTILSQYNTGDRCSLHAFAFVKPTFVGRGD